MRKPNGCRSAGGCDRAADQCHFFRYIDRTIPLRLKSKIQAYNHLLLHSPASVGLGPNPKDRFCHDADHLFIHFLYLLNPIKMLVIRLNEPCCEKTSLRGF